MTSLKINTIVADTNTSFTQLPITPVTIVAYPDILTLPTSFVTKNWVTSAFTYFLGVIHSWGATQSFSSITTNTIDGSTLDLGIASATTTQLGRVAGITQIKGVNSSIALTGTSTLNITGTSTLGGLTMSGSNNITLGNGTVNPSSLQLGFIGYSKNLTAGYYTVGMVTSVAIATPYMYGVATLPAGVYMFSVYFAPQAHTSSRVYLVTGTTKPADPSVTGTGGTTEATFGSVIPSNGGNGIIRLLTGSANGGEFTSFGMGIITTARPNIGLSIGIAGTGTYITGTYSFQYMKVG